ncbi:MAG: hypothetical protein DMD38_15250 [Gemmatimonadetes bacterium]|nr:MAG: hypothetical protein DMD38_15250 [Gemmatimonadota bacterium]
MHTSLRSASSPSRESAVAQRAADRLSVLHVVAPAEFGGLEAVVQALAIGSCNSSVEARVAAVIPWGRADHPFLAPLTAAGVEVFPIAVATRAYLRERAVIAELCRRLQPDVVHTHGYQADVLDADVARRLGIPVVTTVHGFTSGDWKNRCYEWLQRRAFRRFDAVVAVSRPLVRELTECGIPAERVHLIQNGWRPAAPPLDRAAARRALGEHHDSLCIGWVGRLSDEKGPDVFLESLARLRDLPWTACVLGEGPARGTLEARATALGLGERVQWHGGVAGAGRLYAAFDVFVLSSRTEGTPMVLFEAMAAGVPVVATAVGGVPDIVSSAEGALVPANDATALAAAIRTVCSNPAAVAAQARAARNKLARDFGVEPWLRRYCAIYQSVCHRARRRALAGR